MWVVNASKSRSQLGKRPIFSVDKIMLNHHKIWCCIWWDDLICSSYLLIWLVLDWQFSSHQPSNPQAPVSFLQKKSINVKKSIARCRKHEKTHLLITLIESVFMARIMHPFILRGSGLYCDIVHWLILNGHTGPTIPSYGVST